MAKLMPVALPTAFLVGTSFITVWPAIREFANTQDALLFPYLFKDFHLHDVILASSHSNILKFPLFFVQSILPYSFKSYALVNLALAFASLALWCVLIAKIFGRQYYALACVLVGSFVAASPLFSANFAETTMRNIEYPLGLLFLYSIYELWEGIGKTRRHTVLSIAIFLTFSFAAAGDSLLLYSFCLPVVVAGLCYMVVNPPLNKRILLAVATAFAVVLFGAIIKKAIVVAGLATFYNNSTFDAKILPLGHLGPSLARAISQFISLSGANIFGLTVELKTTIFFLNFFMLLAGLIGLYFMFFDAVVKKRGSSISRTSDLSVLHVFMALSFIITLFTYVFSDLALANTVQSRYITLLPLISVIGFVYMYKKYFSIRGTTFRRSLIFLYVVALLISAPELSQSFRKVTEFARTNRQVILNIVNESRSNNVHFIVTGDTTGAPTRFWSQDKIQYATFFSCAKGIRMTANIKKSWYEAPLSPAISSNSPIGLVVDRTRFDAPYSDSCSAAVIKHLYGSPLRVVAVDNPKATEYIELWIYDHDIRSSFH